MKKKSNKIKEFILNNTQKHPQNIVAITSEKFSTSRVNVHRYLNQLIQQGRIIKTGRTKNTSYALAAALDRNITVRLVPETTEHEVWQKHLEGTFKGTRENIQDICSYGFHEMFNNAIEHSEGTKVKFKTEWGSNIIFISMMDDGVGIFNKIMKAFTLKDARESILKLSRGKVTTDPDNHTGEGLFFTSRVFDKFMIGANGHIYIRNNLDDDWFFETREKAKGQGTLIGMQIGLDSRRKLQEVFKAYTNPETKRFDKTHIVVELSKMEDEDYISRSQARRILTGVEKFTDVTLDFKNVRSIGQAFVDEVFRVFRKRHPNTHFTYINANDDIVFMIERGLATSTEE